MPRKKARNKRKLSLKERRKRARIFTLVVGVVAVVSTLVFGILGLRSPEINITQVEVSGGVYTREDLVHRVVSEMLDGSYFFLVPHSNTFLYPKSHIQKELSELFVSLESVSIRRNGLTALEVALHDRTPSALWCTSFEEGAPCYFLDENGLVFTRAADVPSGLLVFSGELSDQPLGEHYLAGAYANIVSLLSNIQTATRRTPEKVSIDAHDDISVFFKEGGEVRFTQKNADNFLLDNIASVFASRRFKTDEQLDYADFRFGSKVYVKFRE